MNITKEKWADIIKISNAPNRKNNRSMNDITIALSLTTGNWNIFSNFLYNIWEKCMNNKISHTSEKITLLDIWCWQWTLLEDIIQWYKIEWIGISKHNERDDNYQIKKAQYKKYDLIDKLPENIKDDSLDFAISLYSLQYIPKALYIIQDLYRKLKLWWRAIISLWTPWHIDPHLLQQIEENNKDIIIQSWFTGDINQKDLLELLDDQNINQYDIKKYLQYSHTIHVLYIQRVEHQNIFFIPPHQTHKKWWITKEERDKHIIENNRHYELIKNNKIDPNYDYIHDSKENLSTLSYSFHSVK